MERQLVTKPGTLEAKTNDYRPSSLSHEPRFPIRGILHSGKNLSNQPKLYPAKLQAKLAVSQPGDPYEQEADRVAEQVMRMPDPKKSAEKTALKGQNEAMVQRKCPKCDRDKESLQKKEAAPSSYGSDLSPAIREVLSSPGRPLDVETQAYMGSRFGHDFSRVRVHTDARATESAQMINAQAYTVGSDIVFGPGKYRQSSDMGRRLLAHELAHTIQQESAGESIQRLTGEEKKDDLKSDRLKEDDRLQKAYDHNPPMLSGETGEGVKTLQRALHDLGYQMPISLKKTGDADGIFGGETLSVVKQFQGDNNLDRDGIVGRQTLRALDQLNMEVPPPLECPDGKIPVYDHNILSKGGNEPAKAQPGYCSQVETIIPSSNCTVRKHKKDFIDKTDAIFNSYLPIVRERDGSNLQEVMFFTGCHTIERDIATNTIISNDVWLVSGDLKANPLILGDGKEWSHGFIQTADNLKFIAEYDNGRKATRSSVRSRDGDPSGIPPWYNDVPSPFSKKPIDEQANLVDSPRQVFPIKHPVDSSLLIRNISCRGTFYIWHIAMNNTLPLDIQNLVFLSNMRITLNLKSVLKQGGDPFNQGHWDGYVLPGNGASNINCNKGASNPVLDQPVTIDDLSNLIT